MKRNDIKNASANDVPIFAISGATDRTAPR